MASQALLIPTLVVFVPACMLFTGSLALLARGVTLSSFLQLLGATCLVIVVVAHVCEALHLFPSNRPRFLPVYKARAKTVRMTSMAMAPARGMVTSIGTSKRATPRPAVSMNQLSPVWFGAILLVIGIVLVLWGAERFTDGSLGVARVFALSPFYVGTVLSGFEPENLVTGG